jgi:hypothetical protein
MIRIAIVANLVAYSIVASQPLAYVFFLGRAQRALSAPAYIELRQRINPVMNRRVPIVYVAALAAAILLLVLSARTARWNVVVTTAIALLCLVIDVIFMTRESGPLNAAVDRWSTTSYPEDWERYRTKWFAVFAYRQVVLLIGLFSLLVGAAFQ